MDEAWGLERWDAVAVRAEAFALRQAVTPEQRAVFETALVGLREYRTAFMPSVHLPLIAHAAITGDDRPALHLAAGTALLFLGVDVFDDLADGDLRPHWRGHGPAVINLAAATLICTLPQLAIAELPAPPAVRAAMQRRLAEGLLRMSAGQQRDLTLSGSAEAEVDAVEAAVAGKSGEQFATYAALAALLAGAEPAAVEGWAALGRALGTAAQIGSDVYELFQADYSADLENGTRTLPLAQHLARQQGAERERFLELLAAAGRDREAREELRQELRAAGAVRRSVLVAETYRQRARLALDALAPRQPWGARLRRAIDELLVRTPPERCDEEANTAVLAVSSVGSMGSTGSRR